MVVLCAVLFLAIAGGVYAAYEALFEEEGEQNTISNGDEKDSSELSESEVEEDFEDVDQEEIPDGDYVEVESASLTNYDNEKFGVHFTHPSNWEVEENEVCDQETGNDCSLWVTIDYDNLGRYKFEYSLPSASGPGVYVYTKEEELNFIFYLDNYTEIVKGKYRRSFVDYSDIEEEDEDIPDKYLVCYYDDGTYTDWVNPGYISYLVGSNFDPQAVEIMDEITKSFTYSGDPNFLLQ
ncbi:MAG: hypothetical protein ABIC57_03140 [bacterium]